jgi:hypothetical protein
VTEDDHAAGLVRRLVGRMLLERREHGRWDDER